MGPRVEVKARARDARRRLRKSHPPGTSPGTLVVDPAWPKPVLSVLAYGPDEVIERAVTDLADLRPLMASASVVWLDVAGLGDLARIEAVGKAFGLHRLVLEDVLDVNQRAKVDRFEHHLYIVAVMAALGADAPGARPALDVEQLSLFLGKNFVITFQERTGDCFDRVRERIRSGKGMIRASGPGYLAYALLDATIDAYFPVLEHYGERLEALEHALVESPTQHRLHEIHALRRDMVALRRAVWPMREALNFLIREGTDWFTPETRPYLNDCYDHTVQLMDLVESQREMASGLMDVHLAAVSNRMNEIMKVLTIIATIFIPLTFLAGVYGMNFDPDAGPLSMPELRWPYGYVATLFVMAAVAVGMLFYFRRLGWIGRRRRAP